MRYLLTILFTNTPESAKMHASALEVSSRAGKALQDWFAALLQRKRSKDAAVYDSIQGSFDSAKDAYQLEVLLWPPQDDTTQAPASSSKKRKAAASNEHCGGASTKHAKIPNENECVNFYSNKPHLWSAFGHAVHHLGTAVANKK